VAVRALSPKQPLRCAPFLTNTDAPMQVTVIIPAYLNNEIGILDETLTAHAACEYRGPMTVMLMYNKKPGSGAKFREAERELVARWNGYSVRNLRCAASSTLYPRLCWHDTGTAHECGSSARAGSFCRESIPASGGCSAPMLAGDNLGIHSPISHGAACNDTCCYTDACRNTGINALKV